MRIGVLGMTHDHLWSNLRELQAVPGATLVGAADPHPELREKIDKEFGCSVYADYDELLEEQKPEAVFIFSDNASGADLIELCAARRISAMVEKPMASTLEGATRALAAVREAGVRLMVNWPFAWWPPLQHAIRLVADGKIGELWQVRYRAAHAGPKEYGCSRFFYDWLYDVELNGGGALMDYCCYGAVLSASLLGLPSRVFAAAGRLRKEYIEVDDNALLVMSYPRAMALAEASWTQIGNLTSYVPALYGTTGTLLVEPGRKGRLLLADAAHPDGTEVEVPEPPSEFTSASAHFVYCLQRGAPFMDLCSERTGHDAQEILEAGIESARSGSEVSLPLRRWF